MEDSTLLRRLMISIGQEGQGMLSLTLEILRGCSMTCKLNKYFRDGGLQSNHHPLDPSNHGI